MNREPLNLSTPFAVVVNDDPTQLNVLSGLVRKADLEPRAFTGAEAALADMSAWAGTADRDLCALPVLVVTDLYMPGIDGWRFCRLLRSPEYAAFNQVPILVVSATFAGDETDRIAADLGAEGFLPSPVNGKHFVEQVRAILSGKRMRTPPRVLIVEDSQTLSGILHKAFADHGYQADNVLTAREAADAFGKTSYDVVVLDYYLPDGTGDALLDTFRAQRPDCVCLMMTTDTGPDLALDWMKRGAAAYLQKPFQTEYLIELCARARRERALLRVQDLIEVRTRELRESRRQLADIVKFLPDATLAIDMEKRVIIWNKAIEEMTGVPAAEMIGRGDYAYTIPFYGKARPQLMDLILMDCGDIATRYPNITREDDTLMAEVFCNALYNNKGAWVFAKASPLHDQSGNVIGAIESIRDITKSKLAEAEKAELEVMKRQLQKAQSLGLMAGAIAHHFNNQLQVVMGNLEMAMDDLPQGANILKTLTGALNAARKVAEVSGLMLTYRGQTPGKLEPLDLSEACRQSLPLFQAAAPKGMIIKADFPSYGPVIRANAGQIRQVLTNLVTNAWEASGENQGVIGLTVKTVSQTNIPASKRFPIDWQPQESVYACLEVTNSGSGIAEKDIEKIFDPFFTTKFIGRGLGLPVVLGIAVAHCGGITVESVSGRGSIFRVFLPVSAEAVPRQPDKAAQIPEMKGSGTVLLVEEEEMVREIGATMLTHLGFGVLEAKDGVEAVEVFRQHQDEIRCVLSDLTMPRMNGWDTLAALRKLSPDIPVILSSGYDEAQVMAEKHPELPDAFLGKPYQIKGLQETINRVLAVKNNDGI
jgi:CheY-like chemotaxis protein